MVTLTHSTIKDGWTALDQASYNGHHKVVELLLRAGANPDLQNKVRTGQNSGMHVNLSNGRLHPVKPGALVNLPPLGSIKECPCSAMCALNHTKYVVNRKCGVD